MPFDPEPHDDGQWVLRPGLNGRPPTAVFVAEEQRERWAGEMLVPHWATCPYADQHRRKGRS